jgi:hypothetical protein
MEENELDNIKNIQVRTKFNIFEHSLNAMTSYFQARLSFAVNLERSTAREACILRVLQVIRCFKPEFPESLIL